MSTQSDTAATDTDTAAADTAIHTPSAASTASRAGLPAAGARLSLTGADLGRPGAVVLHGVDLEATPSEILTLVGPSGCGKSTLLRTLAGLLPALAGQVAQTGGPSRAPALTGRSSSRRTRCCRGVRPAPTSNCRWPSEGWAAPSAGPGRRSGWTGSACPT